MTVIHCKEGGVLIKVGDHTVRILEGGKVYNQYY